MEKKGVIAVLLSIVVMAVLLSFNKSELIISNIPEYMLYSASIIGVSIIFKNIVVKKRELKMDLSLLKWRQWWFWTFAYFKKPLPVGLIIPLLFAYVSSGYIKIFMFLEMNLEPTTARVTKKYGIRRLSGLMDWDYAITAFYGLLGTLLLTLVADLFISQ